MLDTWKHFSPRDYTANGVLNCTACLCSVRTTSLAMHFNRVCFGFFLKGGRFAMQWEEEKIKMSAKKKERKITQWLIVNIPTVEIHEWATLGLALAGKRS